MTRLLLLLLLTGHAAAAASLPFINEIHYDNSGVDIGEGVEIAAAAGTVLDGWSLLLYNGSTGATYGDVDLSGLISDQVAGFGTLFFETGALQNGSPDGLALVDPTGTTLQFLSYEGAFTATTGAAAGLTSTDIGVEEASDQPVGLSLQLTGTGTQYSDFSWMPAAVSSYGDINDGQQFAVVPLPGSAVLLASALLLTARGRRPR